MFNECGSLYYSEDWRTQGCMLETRFDQKRNVMFSFEPYAFDCGCCSTPFLFKRVVGRSVTNWREG